MPVNDEIKKVEDKTTQVISTLEANATKKINTTLADVKDSIFSLLKRIPKLYLLLGCLLIAIIAYFYFFSGDSTKKENNALKSQIAQIQKERDRVKDSLNDLSIKYKKISDSINIKETFLSEINRRLDLIDEKTNNSVNQLNQLRGGVSSINDQIKKNIQKPDKKTGDELLNSLKTKIN